MELWKLLREATQTVDASLPDPEKHLARGQQETGTLRLYRKFHHDGRPYLGTAAMELQPGESMPSESRRKMALDEAATVLDPWYPLEIGPATHHSSRTSTLEKQDLVRWIEPMDEVISKALKSEPVLALREHLRFTKRTVEYSDCFGRELQEIRYGGSLEILAVPRSAPEAHPFSAELRFSEFAPEVIAGFLRDQARLVCDAFQSVAWTPTGEFQVLLRGQTLAGVLDFLMQNLGGPALAAGVSPLLAGNSIGASHDPLTVTALVDIYNSPEPGSFDDEGLALRPLTLVKDGIVDSFWTTQATAHWLGLPLTGQPRNFSVSPGSQSWQSLSGQRILEVHRLRWAQIDHTTGNFSAEVELADLHEAGRRSPVFGFTLQGNLWEVLTNARFSSDVGTWEHCEGPEFLVVPSTLFRSI